MSRTGIRCQVPGVRSSCVPPASRRQRAVAASSSRHGGVKPPLRQAQQPRVLCVGLLLAALFVSTLITGSPAFGQVTTGLPPFSSATPSTFDSVSNANLNVMFAIPIQNKAGKGMPFIYSLGYNSAVWSPYNANGQRVWTPAANWG